MALPTKKNSKTTNHLFPTFPTFPAFRSLIDSFWDSNNFFGKDFSMDEFFHRAWSPSVNIKDNTKTYEVEVAAPGLNKNDFTVNVENGILSIRGEHEESKEEKKNNYSRREFNYSKFERTFSLPENAKEDSVKAKYENGVLKISLTKSPAKKRKAKKVAIA